MLRATELLAGVDYREKIPRERKPTEDDIAEAVRASQESGELSHLYGKPLDLSETTSEWLMRRTLQEAGFSHPLLERGKDLDAAQQEAEEIVEEIRRRRAWLTSPEARCTAIQAHRFNEKRLDALEEYRKRLMELDRAILSHNLSVPTTLQRRQIKVDAEVSAAAEAVPRLDPATDIYRPADRLSTWKRLCDLMLRRQ